MKVLMNSAMMPNPGNYSISKVTKDEFILKWFLSGESFHSTIGYGSTANFLTRILGQYIPVNRTETSLNAGDIMFITKLAYRLPDPKMKRNSKPKDADYEFYIGKYHG